MNRHELIMNTKSIPKSVNLENIERIFDEYEEDIEKERKSNFDIISPYEFSTTNYIKSETKLSHVVISVEVPEREFLVDNAEISYPQNYFDKEAFSVDSFYFGSNSEVEAGENQVDVVDSQPVAA